MEESTPEDPLGNLTAFAGLVDPRDSARCCYPLQELLLVALAGVAVRIQPPGIDNIVKPVKSG